MKVKSIYKIAFFLVFAGLQSLFSQKKDENIGTEVVNVVKPYTPTISDAFKVKETPVLDDEETLKKEEITYNIFSFPVASTFTPSKGRAAAVDPSEQEPTFKNYATLAIGNYTNANAELFITENITSDSYVGGMLRHFSSQGGIKDLVLEDKFSNTSFDLTYGLKQQNLSWTADLGYQHQMYHWYGIQQDYFGPPDPLIYDGIDGKHTFHNFYVGSQISFNESFFKEASVKYNRFWDGLGAAENRFYVKPSFDFDIDETKIATNFVADYVGGNFEKGYLNDIAYNYGFANFGAHPSLKINRDNWTIDLGAAVFYSIDIENTDNKLFVYPKINASLKVVGDLMIFYSGIDGNLQQNAYRDFSNENPFVSPTLIVAPTDKQYEAFAGLKGKLSNNVSYNIRGGFSRENNKPLFRNNPLPFVGGQNLSDFEDYELGNSFFVVYDEVKTINFFGELKADFSKNVAFGINGSFSSYTTDVQEEAWNLPALRLGATLDVQIAPKWYAGTNLFFVGERKDVQNYGSILSGAIVTLDGYFDANAHVGYNHSQRLTGFIKFNNIANQAYERWLNYRVQQFQVLVGASYKFDF